MPQIPQLNTALAGRYAIERLVGKGGMASVYLARDLRHERSVALKVLDPDLAAAVGVERFLGEIHVTANLRHPHLLPLFDSGAADDSLYYVMPYAEDGSLRARIERERQLPIDDVVRIVAAIAGAVDHAHRHGVIHRDLKPENILLVDGQPMVADFGIALALSNVGGDRLTQTGVSLGTPHYLSPEQATGDHVIDGRTDVFALGAMTYEMLAGEPPHTGATSQAIIARVMTEKPRSIRSGRPAVPLHIEQAVARALEKLPADRWATAAEFADALADPRKTAAMTAAELPAATAPRRVRPREVGAWALAAVALLSATYLATRPPTPPTAGAMRLAVELPESVTVTNVSAQVVAVSPDGKQLAILGEQHSERRIYLRRLDDPEIRAVRGSEGAAYHSFTADGRSLLFLAHGALYIVPTLGGAPRKLADSATGGPASSGPGGEVLYSSRSRLWLTSDDGSRRRMLAGPDSAKGITGLSYPEILPGGEYALANVGRAGSPNELGVVSMRDGSVSLLGVLGRAARYLSSGHLMFVREGGLVYAAPFSMRRRALTGPAVLVLDGVRQAYAGGATSLAVSASGIIAYATPPGGPQAMYVVDLKGAERPLASTPGLFNAPRVSPDGRSILVRIATATTSGSLSIYEIGTGRFTRLTGDSISAADWTHDGHHIVYVGQAPADSERLLMRAADGSGDPVVLTPPRGTYGYSNVSLGPPNRLSAFRRGPSATAQIWITPTDSLGMGRPFITASASHLSPRVSPNGDLLAYASDESGRYEVYVTPLPGPGPRLPVSVGGGTEPRWSGDGQTLFYRTQTRVMMAHIVEQPLAIGRLDTLFADTYTRTSYDVFPNGRELLMMRSVDPHSSVYVLVNWQQLRAREGAAATSP